MIQSKVFKEIDINKFKWALFLIDVYSINLSKDETLSIGKIAKMFCKSPSNPTIIKKCKKLIDDNILIPANIKYSFQRYTIDKEKLYKEFKKKEYIEIFDYLINTSLIKRCIKDKHIFI